MSRARDLSRLSNQTNFTTEVATGRVGLGSTTPTAKLNVAGIVSATAFYGDGSNLSGIATNLVSSIGVSSEGTFVGTGATIVDFKSSNGLNNVEISSGIATVTVTTGASIGLVIALGG